jgi:hypothetical protein
MSTRALIFCLNDQDEVEYISQDGYPMDDNTPDCTRIENTILGETAYDSLSYVYLYIDGEFQAFRRI